VQPYLHGPGGPTLGAVLILAERRRLADPRSEVLMGCKRNQAGRRGVQSKGTAMRQELSLPGTGTELAGLLVGERGHPARATKVTPIRGLPFSWLAVR